jgi:hypothetical protein
MHPETGAGAEMQDRKAREGSGEETVQKTLETESDPWERHLLYTRAIEAGYRNRKTDPGAGARVKDLAVRYRDEFGTLGPIVFDRLKDKPRVISAFKLLAMILEEEGDREGAIAVCRSAIAEGVEDGTKGGFQGRIDRILKKEKGCLKPAFTD